MSAGIVQVAPDSTGKKIQTFENSISAETVEAQAVVVVDANGLAASPGRGATNAASSQVTASTGPATLIIARATRRTCLIRNLDTSISVYIGPATVSSSNGMIIKAGESVVVTWLGLLQVIAASGSPVVAVFDEYD